MHTVANNSKTFEGQKACFCMDESGLQERIFRVKGTLLATHDHFISICERL